MQIYGLWKKKLIWKIHNIAKVLLIIQKIEIVNKNIGSCSIEQR